MVSFFNSWCPAGGAGAVALGVAAVVFIIISLVVTKAASDNRNLKWWSIVTTAIAMLLYAWYFYYGHPAPDSFLSGLLFVVVNSVAVMFLFGSLSYILFITEHIGGADYDSETLLPIVLVVSGGIGVLGGAWSAFGSLLPESVFLGFLAVCGLLLFFALVMGKFSVATLIHAPVVVLLTALMGITLLVALSVDPWLTIPAAIIAMIAQSTENPVPNHTHIQFHRNEFGHDVAVRNEDGSWSLGTKYDDYTVLDNGDRVDNENLKEYDPD